MNLKKNFSKNLMKINCHCMYVLLLDMILWEINFMVGFNDTDFARGFYLTEFYIFFFVFCIVASFNTLKG